MLIHRVVLGRLTWVSCLVVCPWFSFFSRDLRPGVACGRQSFGLWLAWVNAQTIRRNSLVFSHFATRYRTRRRSQSHQGGHSQDLDRWCATSIEPSQPKPIQATPVYRIIVPTTTTIRSWKGRPKRPKTSNEQVLDFYYQGTRPGSYKMLLQAENQYFACFLNYVRVQSIFPRHELRWILQQDWAVRGFWRCIGKRGYVG